MADAFDGRAYVVDTSAWAATMRRRVAANWSHAMQSGQLLITPVVALELLYSARNRDESAELEDRLAAMREAPLDRSTVRTAIAAMRELADTEPPHHRVPATDALIAAAAAQRGVGVLHYDAHFDRLATVLGIDSRWIVPRGST